MRSGQPLDILMGVHKGVYGFWHCNRLGSDDIEIFTDDTRTERMTILHHLRQQTPKPNDEDPNYCLADFIAPPGHADYIGGFAVTAGNEIEHLLSEYDDDYCYSCEKFVEAVHFP